MTNAVKTNSQKQLVNSFDINKNNRIFSKIINSGPGLFLYGILLGLNLFAQENETISMQDSYKSGENFSNSVNMCPVSVAFGLYSFNYEHLFGGTHGLVARFDYESISDTYSNNPIKVGGYGYILNYRYHLSGELESIFIGSYARYRIYKGDGTADLEKFDFKIKELTFGLNAGKRWVWDSGFNITFAIGYGLSKIDREKSSNSSSAESTIKAFEDEYTFIGPFLGEFSIGYAF